MATAGALEADRETVEPVRTACAACGRPVLVVRVAGEVIVADAYEWEPRAACYVCKKHATLGHSRRNCDRCGATGYVGRRRPPGRMLAVDGAWTDEGGARVIGPRTPRRTGEALHELHAATCGLAQAG